jgi:predicted dinucleotide-binding enzyme
MKIGIIGTGYIGGTLIKKLNQAGHDVRISDARGIHLIPENLKDSGIQVVEVTEVFSDVDVAILSVPLVVLPKLVEAVKVASRECVLIDTSNYYPSRDQKIDAIEDGKVESIWVKELLGREVVKAWNAMGSDSLARLGTAPGMPGRLAIPVAGDNSEHKRVAMQLVDDSGFDSVDSGTLAESWRHQPGSPAYCTDLTEKELEDALGTAVKSRLPARRDIAVEAITERFGGDGTNPNAVYLVRLNRALFS